MTTGLQQQKRTPLWRNVTVLKWTAQIVVLMAVVSVLWTLGSQAAQNIEDRGLQFGWEWLSEPPGITIREGIDTRPSTGARAILVGIVNMLRVTVSGIIAATILGTIIGIARLSKNWIVSKIAVVYIETIRNIPLLVQIFFWQAIVQVFGPLEEADLGAHVFKLSAKGISIPWFFPHTGFWQWSVFVLIGIVGAVFVYKWRIRVQEQTGEEAHAFTYALGTLLLASAVGWFAHPVAGILGELWNILAAIVDAIPTVALQVALAAVSVLGAAWWIKSFLDSRRTPGGLAKLTDDDYFRLVFAAIIGLAGAALFLLFGDIADRILVLVSDFFSWAEAKFELGRTGSPLRFSRPRVELTGNNFVQYSPRSLVITGPYFAIWLGVTLYTAAFIAEIVRGGILAVPRGQTEAASAVGLRRGQLLRLVILPQAFRIILPPMGNQYLNLAKNTSLGIAVAYADIVQVGQTLYNQTGQSVPVVLVWMGFYLTVSLTISVIVNYYNRKLALVER